jgi:hypothetical protein
MREAGYEWDAENLRLKKSGDSTHLFNVGDWIISASAHANYRICKITKAENGNYSIESTDGYKEHNVYEMFDSMYRPWSIEDANAGDVLVYNDQYFIFKKMSSKNSFIAYCSYHYIGYDSIYVDEKVSYSTENVKPATKEQREYLLSRLSKAGYVWRADKLKLVEVKPTTIEEKDRIDDAFTRMMLKDAEKQNNQNSVEWTESDESMYTRCLGILGKCKCNLAVDEVDEEINWFKSLKEKIMAYQQSIHNWSDRDRDMARFIGNAITTDEASKYLEEKGVEIIDAHVWLDELKERTTPQDWSEYDSKMSSYIVAALDAYCRLRKERDNTSGQEELESAIHWIHNRFKYLKLNQEFVRDSKLIEDVCSYLNRYGNLLDERDSEYAAKIFKLADELKSREVKSIWKPTPEQTSILWDAVCTLKHDNYKHTEIVESLYNELKKL